MYNIYCRDTERIKEKEEKSKKETGEHLSAMMKTPRLASDTLTVPAFACMSHLIGPPAFTRLTVIYVIDL